MKTEKNILIAFILNLAFSIFEFAGGIFIGSVAIISDAVHDIGDAVSIGISYFFEKKIRFLSFFYFISIVARQKFYFRLVESNQEINKPINWLRE